MDVYRKYLAKNIFIKILITIFIIFVLYILFSIFVFKRSVYKDLKINTIETIKDTFKIKSDSIEAYFDILKDEGGQISKDERIKHYLRQYYRGRIGISSLLDFARPKFTEYLNFSRYAVGIVGFLNNGKRFIEIGETIEGRYYIEPDGKDKVIYGRAMDYNGKLYYTLLYPIKSNLDESILGYCQIFYHISTLRDLVKKEYKLANTRSTYRLFYAGDEKLYDVVSSTYIKNLSLRRIVVNYAILKSGRIKELKVRDKVYFIKHIMPYNFVFMLTVDNFKMNKAIAFFISKTLFFTILVFVLVIGVLYVLFRPLFSQYLISLDFLNREIEKKNKELENEKKTFEDYLNKAPVIYLYLSRTGAIKFVNKTGLKMLEMTEEEILDKNCSGVLGSCDFSRDIQALIIEGNKRGKVQKRFISELTSKSGKLYTIEWEWDFIMDSEGYVDGFILAGKDITREMEREGFINLIFESINAFIWNGVIVEDEVKLTFVSNSIVKIIGGDRLLKTYDLSSIKGILHEDDRNKIEIIKRDIIDKGFGGLDLRFVSIDGEIKWVRTWYSSRVVGSKRFIYGFGIEITHERELRSWIEKILDSIAVLNIGYLIYRVDSVDNAVIVDVNEAFERITGYTRDEVVGKLSPLMLIAEDDRERVKNNLKKRLEGEPVSPHYILNITRKDGTTVKVEINVAIMNIERQKYIFVLFTDVTEKLIQQRNLLQQQKMGALGVLASGIAHDFNNILTGILGWISLLNSELKDENQKRMLSEVEKASKRASDLISKLLGFVRMGKYEIKPVNLNNEVKDVVELLKPTIKNNIKVILKLDESLKNIEGDPDQIQQVIMNLAVNAIQAMPDGGELTILTYNFIVTEEFSKTHFNIKPGEYAVLVVNDTGIGIDKSIKDKIFDPFFTTKGKGGGTGLGLSTVYGIVKNHNGAITVYSEVGKGASFKVYLPVSEKEGKKLEKIKYEGIVSGSGTILLVDDESSIIDVYSEFLSDIGYNVIVAMDGKEAVDKFKKYGDNIDIVILDLNIPEKSGSVVYDEVKRLKPDVKVIITTGFSFNGEVQELLDKGVDSYLKKPFDMKEMSQLLHFLLHKK